MTTSFKMGVSSLPEDIQSMGTGRVFWVNTEDLVDARRLIASTITIQDPHCGLSLITPAEEDPRTWLELDPNRGPGTVHLATLVQVRQGLDSFFEEMACIQPLADRLLIVLTSFQAYLGETDAALAQRMASLAAGVQRHDCTVLLVTYGEKLMLGPEVEGHLNTWLSGFASLRANGAAFTYQLSYWCNAQGISVNQTFPLTWSADGGWENTQTSSSAQQFVSDSDLIVGCSAVLEGLPPISADWKVFDTNKDVYDYALSLQAATVIFCLQKIEQIEEILQDVHFLRLNRGNRLKVIVREMGKPILRLMDETCLVQCGVSAIIPWSATLARFLIQVRAVQGQTFDYPSLPDIATVLDNRRLLDMKGYQRTDVFCDAVQHILNISIGTTNEKGLLVLLKPVQGLSVREVLSVCNPQRNGDIVTTWDKGVVLFLSFCSVKDIDLVLSRLFGLPVQDLFMEKTILYSEGSIHDTLVHIRRTPVAMSVPAARAADVADLLPAKARPVRVSPRPTVLFSESGAGGSR
ncbi:cellulose biosynthesis protein BcsE [Acetobacter peroxydans]|jgi:cellulose biosynthesis protein BcsE|uniref:cellulose biosynthesis protein BcsE n=1 Tax=Acetobacter peroxydans TaxID=104098 RepID=UPI002356F66E|nr:cellulose biosynthesis protein BcsE [Acetobacter peroxydans]MCH4143504.1 cellulose biosynthesis protein BcsE [Acetobacter peroxydans]MCI1394635.1 cellulose biosynthesis protein BcsE [Acetobacter peroxydans]MCI1411967.1 cellulose biosynthesis protein BcsE [Acetobacter peroxydans]MCI1439878.1 cellulose biosynthesis protein BcsE [Acetobacter peroxydans]MCI1567384.1 cellulose biosynthesis protein BcsE [Acetobacter peroxydans]